MAINLSRVFGLLIVATVVAGLLNVYADAGPIERMARARVCERHSAPCRERLGSVLRTPFYHQLEFIEGGKPTTVRCRRSFVFVGDFSCAIQAP